MFTGIVEEVGRIEGIDRRFASAVLRIRGPIVTSDASPGDSICVAGVCLTVVECDDGVFSVDVMAETLHRSSLGALRAGSPVNLERAMAADGRFGGHIVQGHVDGTGEVIARRPGDHWEEVTVSVPKALRRYVVEKGSVALDGVSLTVSALCPEGLQVGLIPTTLSASTLGQAAVGSTLNIEVDVLAKYVERLLAPAEADGPQEARERRAAGGRTERETR